MLPPSHPLISIYAHQCTRSGTALLLSAAWCADQAQTLYRLAFGAGPAWQSGIGAQAVYTLLFFIAYDLGRWLAHTCLHDSKLLWEFHKVHHSAEVLTPATAFRVHPVDLLVTLSVPSLTTAPITGLFLYLYADAVTAWSFLGAALATWWGWNLGAALVSSVTVAAEAAGVTVVHASVTDGDVAAAALLAVYYVFYR